MDAVGPIDDEQLPPYELSQVAFDAKTEEAIQRSLQLTDSPHHAEHASEQGDAPSPVLPPPQPLRIASRPSSSPAGPSSPPLGPRTRPRRAPLPPIPTARQPTKIIATAMNSRNYARESIPNKEAERFMHGASPWTPPLVVENESRPSSVQSVDIRPPSPPSSRYSYLDSAERSEGFNDDGEAPPPFSPNAPPHGASPLSDVVSPLQGIDPRSGAAGQYHDPSGIYPPAASPNSLLASAPHSNVVAPEDLEEHSSSSQFRRHRLSLPNTSRPNLASEMPARSSTIFIDDSHILPPPILFNPAIAYVQKDPPAILRGVTTEEDEAASPEEFYNAAVSSVMASRGLGRPPRRPRTSKGALSNSSGVSISYPFAPSGSQPPTPILSVRGVSPTVNRRPLSPYDVLDNPFSPDVPSTTLNSSAEYAHPHPHFQSFSAPSSLQTYGPDRYPVPSDRVSFHHPLDPPLPPPSLPMHVHSTSSSQWGPTHQRRPSSRPPNPMY